jgi:hypothetical protein
MYGSSVAVFLPVSTERFLAELLERTWSEPRVVDKHHFMSSEWDFKLLNSSHTL